MADNVWFGGILAGARVGGKLEKPGEGSFVISHWSFVVRPRVNRGDGDRCNMGAVGLQRTENPGPRFQLVPGVADYQWRIDN